jgi:cytochrome P450
MVKAVDIGINEAERIRNRMNGLGVVNDLHDVFDALRRAGDVHPGGLPTLFDQPDFAFFVGFDDAPRFTVIGYDSAQHVFRNHETFSSQLYAATAANWGPNLLMMDEPGHARYRALAQPAFALRTMESWHDRWLLPTLERLIGALDERERCDLYMELCARFPAHTIGAALGISEDETALVHDWIIRTATNMPKEESEAAGANLAEFLRPIIEDRRLSPGDDLISLLATSVLVDDDGSTHRLSDAEIMGFCGLLLIAGTGTTYRATGILLLAVLSRPELLARIRADRSLIPRCVEEVLRWEPPLTSFSRLVTEDTVVDGMHLPAGALVDVGVGAANRDPRRWHDPHRYDPLREPLAHLGFGRGPHFCMGNQLARMEMRTALELLLDRFPDIALDQSLEAPYVTGVFFRMPTSVPVTLR